MGTTAEKGARVLQSIAEVQEGINNLGGSLTDQTPFKDFKTELDNIYDTLPKTSFQEGTEVTIENGLKGKIDFDTDNGKKIVGYGDTSQESTTGKNIYPSGTSTQTIGGITFTPQIDGGIKLQGTSTYSNYYVAGGESNYVDVPNLSNLAETVTLSVSGMQEGIQVYVVGQTLGAKGTSVSGSIGFTTTANDKYRLFIRVMANNTVNTTLYIQLEKGSSATSFEKYTNGASPNPSYPQDIEVVRGKNRLNYNNLLSYATDVGIIVDSEGNISDTTPTADNRPYDFAHSNWKTKLNADTYTLSLFFSKPITAQNANGVIYKSDGSAITTFGTSIINVNKFTTSFNLSNDTEIGIIIKQYDGIYKIQLEKGSQATSYLPYNTLEVKVQNENLLPNYRPSTQTLNGVTLTNNGDGTLKLNGTASAYTQFVDSDSFDLEAGTYTLYERNTNYSGVTAQLRSPDGLTTYTQTNTIAVFTLTEKTSVRFRMVLTSGTVINDVDVTPMILKGNVSSNIPSYVEHQEQIKQLSLGDIELCKIGNYQDYLYKSGDKWYKHEEVGKIILDGSTDEHWFIEAHPAPTEISNRFICDNLPSLDVTTQKDFNYGFCNLGHISSNAQYATDLNAIRLRYINGQNRLDCMFDIESVAILKPLLQNTPMKVYYQKLGGTTDIELTDTTLIEQLENWYNAKSYNGTTIIESNGDLPMIIKVRALKGE